MQKDQTSQNFSVITLLKCITYIVPKICSIEYRSSNIMIATTHIICIVQKYRVWTIEVVIFQLKLCVHYLHGIKI